MSCGARNGRSTQPRSPSAAPTSWMALRKPPCYTCAAVREPDRFNARVTAISGACVVRAKSRGAERGLRMRRPRLSLKLRRLILPTCLRARTGSVSRPRRNIAVRGVASRGTARRRARLHLRRSKRPKSRVSPALLFSHACPHATAPATRTSGRRQQGSANTHNRSASPLYQRWSLMSPFWTKSRLKTPGLHRMRWDAKRASCALMASTCALARAQGCAA